MAIWVLLERPVGIYEFWCWHFQTDVVEKYIENHLTKSMEDFSMTSFISQLQ